MRINELCQVIKPDGTCIENLYAAGEMVDGIRAYGYAGGDSLAQAITTGMVAGEEAAK